MPRAKGLNSMPHGKINYHATLIYVSEPQKKHYEP